MSATGRLRIQHWHRHYRVREPHVIGWERLASEAVLVAFEKAIADVVTDEREVVLLRKVALRFTAFEPEGSHLELAEQWGRAMATAVQEAIKRNDPDNVRRFADIEEHLVCFLHAIVSQQNADAWYFARLGGSEDSQLPAENQIESLLERHLDCWPEVLAQLSQRGLFPSVMRQVSWPLQQQLWSVGIRGLKVTADRERERPVFAAALQIVSRICRRQFDSLESNNSFQAYINLPQPETDWSDATHLAEAVYSAIRFVLGRFSLKLDVAAEAEASLTTRIDAALQTLDWLDREWLQRRLVIHATRNQPSEKASTAAATRPGSPKLAAWEQAWQRVESRFLAECDSTTTASPGNCLLALSLLVENHADWVHDPALPAFVERLLKQKATNFVHDLAAQTDAQNADWELSQVHVTFQKSEARPYSLASDSLSALSASDAQSALPPSDAPSASDASDSFRESSLDGRQFTTAFAGVFLLVRGLQDLRLSSTARQTGFPNADATGSAALLAQLACLWNQCDWPNQPDHGLLEFARLYSTVEWNDLVTSAEIKVDEHAGRAFQSQLTRTLIGLGTWSTPSRLHVMAQEASDGRWLLGGDIEGRVFPWCVPVDNSADISCRIESTIEFWRSETSRGSNQPVELLMDKTARSLAGRLGESASLWEPDPMNFIWTRGFGTTGDVAGEDPLLARQAYKNQDPSLARRAGEATLRATAACVLRHWARSLRGVGTSSNEFLLTHLIQRPGAIAVRPGQIDVTLQARPMDAALHVSGLFDSLDFFNGRDLVKMNFQTVP